MCSPRPASRPRAFYRHFASKSDLLLAIYDHEVERYRPRLQRRLDAAATPREGLEAWIDELLAAGFEPRRGERTRAMFTWAMPLATGVPGRVRAPCAPRSPIRSKRCSQAGLADGTFPNAEPRRHALFIRALTWELVEEHLSGAPIDVAVARDEVLAVLPAGARRAALSRQPRDGGCSARTRSPLLRRGRRDASACRHRGDAVGAPATRWCPTPYEHSPLVRSVWEAAGVHPRDISSLGRLLPNGRPSSTSR